MEWSISLKYAIQSYNHVPTECTKSYRKSVLHLLKYKLLKPMQYRFATTFGTLSRW